ncbi:MAG: TonB-dependent receptor [Caulobacteraceae bacterium]
MKTRSFKKAALLFSTALTSAAVAGAALAQPATANPNQIEEIVVTATRQSQNINVVPLSVTAQTQKNLDQQGVQRINDLAAIVPGFRISGQEGSGNVNIAIRGVVQTTGAATTGFYLDEAPLQKRNGSGFNSQNGAPVPAMFDLDRIEVLRGPQGTLFGGSSEGGTIRYIQAQPSLTHYSAYARGQYSGNAYGGPSYEAGAAVGGPIIQDKLGFRASVFARKIGGFIDLTSPFTQKVLLKDSNQGEEGSARLAFTYAPMSNWTITGSFFASFNETKNNSTTFNLPVPGTLTVPAACFKPDVFAAFPLSPPSALTLARSVPPPICTGPGCSGFPAFAAAAAGIYQRPGYTLGPYNLSPYQQLAIGPTPTGTQLQVAAINQKFDLPHDMTFLSNTSYVVDYQSSAQPQTFPISSIRYTGNGIVPPTYAVPGQAPITIVSGVPFDPNVTASVNQYPGSIFVANTHNSRAQVAQEFRLVSAPNQTPISYVVGAYFSSSRQHINQIATMNGKAFTQLNGATIPQLFGVADPGFFANITETDTDVEAALFGEATWHVTDKLNLLAGLRVTHLTSTFDQSNYGPNSFNTAPSLTDGTLVRGSIIDDPVTPKFSAEYTLAPREIVYATAAKGFRAGGINPVITSTGLILSNLIYGVTDTSIFPKFYKSDSVWSYEVGGKFSLLDGRAQLNLAGFWIDWSDVQYNVGLGGDSVNTNIPKAVSKGVEIETQIRPFRNLSLNGSAAYDHAEYRSAKMLGPIQVTKVGQVFPQPEWTASAGARYDIPINDRDRAYVRADYRWTQGFVRVPVGNPAYSPDNNTVPETRNVDLRLGFEHENAELNIFALNLTDNREGAIGGGRTSCLPPTDAACTVAGGYNPFRTTNWGRPREIGVQVVFRH